MTKTTMHTFTMTEAKAELVHKLANSHMGALKNWIASAVEDGKLEYAQKLVAELREHEALFAAFNMAAKHTIAECTGNPLETAHTVRSR